MADQNSKVNNSKYSNSDEVDVSLLFNLIIRNKLFILSITSFITLIGIIYTLIVKPVYIGSFKIVVNSKKPQENISFLSSGFNRLLRNNNNSKTQEFILQSPSVLKPVYDFAKESSFAKELNYEKWFQKTLAINFTEGTSILNVSYKDHDKKQIIDVLNLIKNKYQNYSKEERKKELNKTKTYFLNQKKLLSEKSKLSMSTFNKFSIKNGLGDIDGFVSLRNTKRRDFINNSDEDLIQNQIQTNNFNDELQEVQTKKSGQRFANQFALLEKYEADYINYSSVLKPNSKLLLNLKTKIENLRTALERPNEILLKYRELYQIANRDETLLNNIENSLQKTNLEIAKQEDPWKLISEPTISDSRVFPQRKKTSLFTLIFAFIFSSLLAYLKEKKSGIVYEFYNLNNSINCPFLEEITYDNLNLNQKLVQVSIDENNLNKDKGKITLINLSKNFDQNNLPLKNLKNYKILHDGFEQIKDMTNFENVCFLIKKGEISNEEILLLNKYIKINQNEIIGWFLIANKFST